MPRRSTFRAPRAYRFLVRNYRLNLDTVGRWRLLLQSDGRTLVDAPLDVVAGATANRPPNPPAGVELSPVAPAANDVVFCLVHNPLELETAVARV
jgi:hypothetical protein